MNKNQPSTLATSALTPPSSLRLFLYPAKKNITKTPIHYSNVRLVDPVTRAPVRVSWRFLEDGSKVRVTVGKKASGSVVPRPEVLAQRRTPAPLPGAKDTPASVASRVTHVPGSSGPSVMRPLQEVLRSGVSKRGAEGGRGFAASAVR